MNTIMHNLNSSKLHIYSIPELEKYKSKTSEEYQIENACIELMAYIKQLQHLGNMVNNFC